MKKMNNYPSHFQIRKTILLNILYIIYIKIKNLYIIIKFMNQYI